MNTYTARNETWIAPAVDTNPTYHLAQRTVGYADNDGRWVAQRVAPTSWRYGILHRTGTSLVLGVFDTEAEARDAAAADLAVWETEAHTTEAVR